MDLVPQHIANGTSKFNGQPRLRSLVGRLGVDQAVTARMLMPVVGPTVSNPRLPNTRPPICPPSSVFDSRGQLR